jgi:hypothetical protein
MLDLNDGTEVEVFAMKGSTATGSPHALYVVYMQMIGRSKTQEEEKFSLVDKIQLQKCGGFTGNIASSVLHSRGATASFLPRFQDGKCRVGCIPQLCRALPNLEPTSRPHVP